jgi:hypothetical protein
MLDSPLVLACLFFFFFLIFLMADSLMCLGTPSFFFYSGLASESAESIESEWISIPESESLSSALASCFFSST